MKNTITEIKISTIKIGNRHRNDMGDIEGLAQSIEELGLLQPIGVTPDNELIFGERRLRAYRDVLGRQTIPARIITVKSLLLGQIAEDTMRKNYTVSERLAIVDALRSYGHGGDRRSKQARNCELEKLTIDEAAKRVGFSKDAYFRAKKVAETGVPELVEAMDGGKVSISAAAQIAELPAEDQIASARIGRKRVARDPYDFYPTPPNVTLALLEQEEFSGEISEPACGDGAMSKVLKNAGYSVISSDLVDRGYGDVEDFLDSKKTHENTVTNPPFDWAEQFVKKALACTRRKVAMFLPLTFLESQRRSELLRNSPLKTVYVFTNRVSLYKPGVEAKGNGRVAFCWFVWEQGYKGHPQLRWISTADKKKVTRPRLIDSAPKRMTPVALKPNVVSRGDFAGRSAG